MTYNLMKMCLVNLGLNLMTIVLLTSQWMTVPAKRWQNESKRSPNN